MKTYEVHERIAQLRAEISSLVDGVGDLARPEVLEKSRELDRLVVAHYKMLARCRKE